MNETQKAPESWPEIAARWWRDLQDIDAHGNPNPKADRSARARLRRATPEGAVELQATIDLYRRLAPERSGFDIERMRLAVRLALVLAHVRENVKTRFARSLGVEHYGDDPRSAPLSPLRLNRLRAARSEDEIIREFRRAADIAGNAANVRDLAAVLLNWDKDSTRTCFAFDYFDAGSAAPHVSADAAA